MTIKEMDFVRDRLSAAIRVSLTKTPKCQLGSYKPSEAVTFRKLIELVLNIQ